MDVTAHVERRNGWYAIEVPEIPGLFTQAKTLDRVQNMVKNAASTLGMSVENITIIEKHCKKSDMNNENPDKWEEITVPILDDSNDYIMFYAKASNSSIIFTDDGYTFESFRQRDIQITPTQRENIEKTALKRGAIIKDNEIILESNGNKTEAMNQFAQILLTIKSMV